MNLLPHLLSWSLLVGLAAQQPQPMTAPRFDLATALGVSRDGDDLVGIGPRYLLRAEADRVSFLPVLGPAAPRRLPLALRFVGARRGGEPVPVQPPQRGHGVRTVVFERGSVREQYELRAGGVEQTFTFARQPAGSGDLVVQLAIEAAVPGVPTAAGGVAFLEQGRGVDYGALLGVDARGRTQRGEVRLGAGTLELVLPHAFVATAAYPLTFDPLVGPATTANSVADDGDPAVGVAESGASARWLIAWRRVVALGESHLIAQKFDTDPATTAPVLLEGGPGIDVTEPRIAAAEAVDQFVVAWRSRAGLFASSSSLKARTVAIVASGLSPILTVSTNARTHALANAALANTSLPIAWHEGTGAIVAARLGVALPATLSILGAPSLQASSFSGDTTIAMSRNGSGSPARYLMVWSAGTSDPANLLARVIDVTGQGLGPVTPLTTGAAVRRQPAVDGDGTDFLVSWVDSGALRVRPCVVTSASGTSTPALTGAESTLATVVTGSLRNGDLVRAGGAYLAAWQTSVDAFDTAAKAVTLTPAGIAYGPVLDLVGPPRAGGYGRQGVPRLAARNPADLTRDAVLAVFEEGQVAPPFDRDIALQFLEVLGAGGDVTTIANGCGVGAVAATNGPCGLGNPGFAFTCTNADPSAPLLLLSLALPTTPLPCGPCALLAPTILETHVPQAGAASRGLPIPPDSSLLNAQVLSQWLPAFGVPGPCPTFPFLSASNIVRATIGL